MTSPRFILERDSIPLVAVPLSTRDPPAGLPPAFAALALILAGLAAYINSFHGPFVLDDGLSIAGNPSIRHLWPITTVLQPPIGQGISVAGRPLLNLSLALNYIWAGDRVTAYHVTNLAIHLFAGVLLFGLVRRTLDILGDRGRVVVPPRDAIWFSLAAALVWTLHPLQTGSVTYIIQRAESLMGLFFLLTLYTFVRGVTSARPAPWLAGSVAACVAGMATKEVMVAAPLVVLLYDHAFVSGGLTRAWRERRLYYSALAATWLLLAFLVLGTGGRGGTIGAAAGASGWTFALAQIPGVMHYARLMVWPQPLIFDYGPELGRNYFIIIIYGMVELALLVLIVRGLRRRSVVAFLGAWFFLILAPSSSVVGGTRQMLAEQRVYLPLAAFSVLLVAGLARAFGRTGLVVSLGIAFMLGAATFARNGDYRDAVTLWRDTAEKRPGNPWAWNNLGLALRSAGQVADAANAFIAATKVAPAFAEAHNNLGNAWLALGRVPAAIAEYTEVVRLVPRYADAHADLAGALLDSGQPGAGLAHAERAVQLAPQDASAHNTLGSILATLGRLPAAEREFEAAVRFDPSYALAHRDLGTVRLALGRVPEALAECGLAVELDPRSAEAQYTFGNALAAAGNAPAAIAAYIQAVHLQPVYPEAEMNLGNALLAAGNVTDALAHNEAAVRDAPAWPEAHYNLANVLLRARQPADAAAQYREALRLRPNFPEARAALARLEQLASPAPARDQ